MKKLRNIISKPWAVVALLVLFSVVASTQSILRSPKQYTYNGENYTQTHYNNYVIFKSSFHHLQNNQDLYCLHLDEHWDLFKYTPTFAAFFGIFAYMPDWLGLNMWNLLNVLLLVLAVYYLPQPMDRYKKGLLLVICAIELLTSIQNAQSNAIIAGLTVLAFGLLENKKYLWATLCIVASTYIKLFGIVGFALFLLYPQKLRSALYSLMWAVVLFAIPLVFVSWEQYNFLLSSFISMLGSDHDTSYGYSVLGWLHTWFGWIGNKFTIVGIGALLFMLPFTATKEYDNFTFKAKILSSLLIWIVIFNHKAESPTFIIAMVGVAIWFILSEKNWVNCILFALAFVFTTLSPTDIFPRSFRENIVNPYCLKGVACILVWAKINLDFALEYIRKREIEKTNEIAE